jgi:asparagine synthase (glutamine-hydrolysing)
MATWWFRHERWPSRVPSRQVIAARSDGVLGSAPRVVDFSGWARCVRRTGLPQPHEFILLLRTYLLGNGIDQCDRLSMAASVEGRLPLVDYRLVEIAIGLRKGIEDWRLPRKQWLLDSARSMVPGHVFRRKKRGFTPPWQRWYPAIFARYGTRLCDGVLQEAGILRPMRDRPAPFDALGRPSEFLLSAIMLEEWARGMRGLAASAR